jgi:cytochrome c oxidase assembly protein subunit 15
LDAVALTGLPAHSEEARNRRQIAIWLLSCCVLVFSMVVLGGVTRLTGSGLSMVEWEPISGVLPPQGESGWEAEFARYRQSPEYQKVNLGMTLTEFKFIFWFEYAHRLLGRALGLVFLLPFLYFLIRAKIERALLPRLIFVFLLGGLQGLLGWYMVKSGLIDNPHVSQYRLAAHLTVAVAAYGYMFWLALGLLGRPPVPVASTHLRTSTLKGIALLVTPLVVFTMLSGAFVAGLKAGLAYNTFPKMGDVWIPAGLFVLDPFYRNFFENIVTVQFQHRVLAMLVLSSVVMLWFLARRHAPSQGTRIGSHLLLAMTLLQLGLGITTLLLYVPIPLAAAHQANALFVFTVALYLNHTLQTSRNSPREAPRRAQGKGRHTQELRNT